MSTAQKLGLSLAILVLSFPMVRLNGWFGLGIPIGLLLSILYWFDLGHELRAKPPTSRAMRLLVLFMGIPQVLFGLLCLAAGVAIIGWVVYNSFWHREPEYTGGFLTLGIGPLLALFGVGWIVDAFRRNPPDGA